MQAAPCPHGPELRFLQDYDDVTIAAGPEVTSLPPEVRVTMVSDPLTDGWYVGTSNTRTYMLIVCPNCSTSYTIEPGSLGSAGSYCPLRALQDDLVRGHFACRNDRPGGRRD